MARDGDTGNQISDYRGLARRQPILALAFATLLLGQAGVPFTTGFLAKLDVVEAAVKANSIALAVVAMVTAVIAGFFVYSATREEKFLAAQFPDTFPAYKAKTKMLIPFVF